ncbi:protein Mpv17-like isoform X3 [Abrus precatorius]|uniref:Protein Mpv17-like isoform X3 n=1 Tax=Abrus precatorius TaxID=3816 RepID=A0A8B8JGI5_ABRPR|nr:protein Mpv17-like isoform X3 [Abrus precatorius]
MLKLWKWYQNCLALHPVKTQVISSGLIWGAGDIAAQAVTHYTAKTRVTVEEVFFQIPKFPFNDLAFWKMDKQFKINWKRVSTTSLYEGLDRVIRLRLMLKPNSFRFVATKVAVDGFIFGPLDLLVFFTYMGFSTGKSVPQIKEDVKRDFLPAFVVEGGIWPMVQVANFRFIPVRYQLLYVNFFCLLDSCFLSWVEQQQDASWKQWLKSFLPLK